MRESEKHWSESKKFVFAAAFTCVIIWVFLQVSYLHANFDLGRQIIAGMVNAILLCLGGHAIVESVQEFKQSLVEKTEKTIKEIVSPKHFDDDSI